MRASAVFTPRARLPELLALILVVLITVQLGLPARVDLLPDSSVARINVAPLPADPAPVLVPASLTTGDLFAPIVTKPTGAAATDPLGGIVIAGVVQRGATRVALVQGPGNAMHYVAEGGIIAGWRLMTLGPRQAQLRRAGNHLDLVYGGRPISQAANRSVEDDQ